MSQRGAASWRRTTPPHNRERARLYRAGSPPMHPPPLYRPGALRAGVLRAGALAVALVVGAVLGGCATGRTEVTPPAAAPASAALPADAPAVAIVAVVDARVFEDAPADPSTPSLGEELASKASADTRARAVGRKRHGYGGAQGDVVLQPPATAAGTLRDALAAAFGDAGYAVRPAPEAGARAVRAEVVQFWLWVEPGFVATIRSRSVVRLAIDGRPPMTVTAETAQSGQIVTRDQWAQAVARAVEGFRQQVALELRRLPR